MTTAEWKCTTCGATNRKLVPADATESVDRCVTCHTPHVIRSGARPAFWQAAVKP
jgi:DNA-directed RNA polymerase subunit RPC12/RpoP